MRKLLTLGLVFLFTGVLSSNGQVREKRIKDKDASIAIDSFFEAFYEKEYGVCYATSEKKDRAAIWVQATYWDMISNAFKRTNNPKYMHLMNDFFQGMHRRYDNFNWGNAQVWFIYDDIMWWVISLARGYELTGNSAYLELSESGFERVWSGYPGIDEGSYDLENGGMYWGWHANQRGKMACINFPTVIGAMTLYNATKEELYLQKAKNVYAWGREVLFDQTEGKVADHQVPGDPTNWKTHLYNQATFIGAAVLLYKKTKEQSYLEDAILAADYTKNVMSDEDGMLNYESGIEQGIYAAIFAQYISPLIYDCGQSQYKNWLRYNINTAWKNRDKQRNITHKNIKLSAPTGVIESYDASACPSLMQVIK